MVEIGVNMGEWESHVEEVMRSGNDGWEGEIRGREWVVSVLRGDGERKSNNQPSSQERVSWQKNDKRFSQLA